MSEEQTKVAAVLDTSAIREAIDHYLEPGQLTELRALNAKLVGSWKTGTYSGYFDREHCCDLVAACQQIEHASGIYFIPNSINPALHARAFNRARLIRDKEPVTTDKDILRRRWLLIDVDPTRPANISSTPQEKEVARAIVTDIDYYLWGRGFPPGIIADSGNGWHLTIPLDLPATDGGKVERLLKKLAEQFDCPDAKVDTTVHNAARIWKLPGTMACKGDSVFEIGREWRIAKIVQICLEVPADA